MKVSVIICTLALSASAAFAAVPKDTAATVAHAAFDPARNADQDIRLAVNEAAATHKRVLLDVGGNWCKWCKMLDAFFDANADVSRLLHEKYVVVKVNFSKDNENKEVLSRYPKVPGYPHFFVLNADGTLLHSQDTGVLEKGQGYDPEKMKAFLNLWAN